MAEARDWDKELAEIDRLIDKPGGTAPAPSVPARRPTGKPAVPPGPERRGLTRKEVLGTWARAAFGVALAISVLQWPFASPCGFPLMLHAGAIGMVMVAGLWSAAVSWRRRIGAAHVVSLVTLLTGVVLAMLLILPRIGYAREAASWFCS